MKNIKRNIIGMMVFIDILVLIAIVDDFTAIKLAFYIIVTFAIALVTGVLLWIVDSSKDS